MSNLLDLLAGLLIIAGSSVVGLAGLGLIKLPDPFTRMHAATKAGVVGSGLVMLGVALSLGSISALVTGVFGVAFLLATSPIASHALGRAAYSSGAPIAPSTSADALKGVLPRHAFDGAMESPVRRPPAVAASKLPAVEGDGLMSTETANADIIRAPAPRQRDDARPSQPAGALRSITAWLVGGPAQSDSSRVALDLTRANDALLIGLSAMDVDACGHRGPAPIGGLAWASWLGEQQRTRMRDRCARALAELDTLSAASGAQTSLRHEEGGLLAFRPVAASSDLIIVPAGVDRIGEPAHACDEIANELAASGFAPVLRVRRRPLAVRRVAMVVSNSAGCGRLAQALLRTGLWRDATIMVIPVGVHRRHVMAQAEEQARLLEGQGYDVLRADGVELEAERSAIIARFQGVDAVILGTLSNRRGWFGAVREDIHELAADTASLALLP